MGRIKTYISSNFVKSFLTIFLPFFLIVSLVYLVKISSLTAQIQITVGELFKLYAYSVPNIFFYASPISFIAALTNLLLKLSHDNELIALYSFGLKASKILKSFLLIGILFSLLLASISFLVMPMMNQLYNQFIDSKKADAKLNISPGKLGQKFGNYYVYVKDKNKGVFDDMVIYNRTNMNSEQFFAAKTGKLHNKKMITSLLLNDGYGYTYSKNKLQQAKYKSLEVYDSVKKRVFKFENIVEHWSQASTDAHRMGRLIFFIFVSLIPFLSISLVASFAMINPRYQSDHSFLIIFITAPLLYFIGSSLEKWHSLPLTGFTIVILLLFGQWLFRHRVSRYF